jgi:chromate reductase
MSTKPTIFAIIGSASKESSNLHLVRLIKDRVAEDLHVDIFDRLAELPPFDPELSVGDTPQKVIDFRQKIEEAEGLLICTPEYIFSIPSGLKNAIEWCVATTVFANKPTGLITASASGKKAHEELQLIMKTVETNFTEATTLLIPGIKGKMDREGNLVDAKTNDALTTFIDSYKILLRAASS